MSVAIAANDAVLIRCFAGCDVSAVLAAAGLSIHDLFVPRVRERTPRPQRRAGDNVVRAFIDREIERERVRRLERSPFDTPNARSADVNAARRRANALYGRQLAPIAVYAWEGYAPHDSDPACPGLFAYACERIAHERYHFKYPWAPCGDTETLPPRLHPEAADLAALWLHEIAIGASR